MLPTKIYIYTKGETTMFNEFGRNAIRINEVNVRDIDIERIFEEVNEVKVDRESKREEETSIDMDFILTGSRRSLMIRYL